MNNVTLIGRCTKDLELRYIPATGKAVVQMSIAVDRPFSKTKEADFFNVVIWGKTAENCATYLKKGSQCAVLGSIQNRSYDAPDGTKRYITEIMADTVQFLDRKEKAEDGYTALKNDSYNAFG